MKNKTRKYTVLALLSLLLFILHTSFVIAEDPTLQIKYYIQPDNTVKITNTYTFDTPYYTPTILFFMNEEPTSIQVQDNTTKISYDIHQIGTRYQITIYPARTTNTLTMNYTLRNTVYTQKRISHFFTEIPTEIQTTKANITLTLPTGYTISEEHVYPNNSTTTSDGTHIIIQWNNMPTKNTLISVKYAQPTTGTTLWMYTGIILALIILLTIISTPFLYKYHKRKTQKEFIKGFSQDERKAIEYLEQHPNTWQKNIEEQCQFTRVKTTRVLKRLQDKGLITKQEQGRINNIKWIR